MISCLSVEPRLDVDVRVTLDSLYFFTTIEQLMRAARARSLRDGK